MPGIDAASHELVPTGLVDLRVKGRIQDMIVLQDTSLGRVDKLY